MCVFAAEIKPQDDELRRSAYADDAESQFKLGNEYFYGTGNRGANHSLAVYWYRKAAENGLGKAQLNLGICLEQGLGTEKNPREALVFYERAEQQGLHAAGFNRAMLIFSGSSPDTLQKNAVPRDPGKGKELLEKLAQQKYTPAMVELASILLNEQGVPRAENAVRLLLEAEKQPDVPTKCLRLLADCYFSGTGVQGDIFKAESLLQRAVRKNDAVSMTRLAYFYERGIVVKKSEEKVLELYKKAASSGEPLACFKLACLIEAGKVSGATAEEATALYQYSALKKCPQAIHYLALKELKNGRCQTAAEMLLQSARMGHAESQYELAVLYECGTGLQQDDTSAFFWFAHAALRGHAAAMRKVGLCYYDGKGIGKDNKKGAEWIRKAAEAGDIPALQMTKSGRRSAW